MITKKQLKDCKKGLIAFGTEFFNGREFRIDDAVTCICRIAYSAAKNHGE